MVRRVKSHTKTSINLTFPVGNKAHLADLELWLREFDRVVDNVSNNYGLLAQDKITHLLAAWPADGETMAVDRDLRFHQTIDEYAGHERAGRHDDCWLLLLDVLRANGSQPFEARKAAQKWWND